MTEPTLTPDETLSQAREVLARRVAESGEDRESLLRRCAEVGARRPWDFLHILRPDDWRETLDARLTAARATWDERVAKDLRSAVGDVLPAALGLTSAERLSHMAPALRTWAAEHDPSRGALLLGLSGVGKSMACVELAHRVHVADADAAWEADAGRERDMRLPPSVRVRLVSARRIAGCVEYGQALGAQLLVIGAFDADALVIDDLGWEPAAGLPAIREVVASRYDQGRPTIVTSGETLSALRDKYGDALLRRVRETRGERGALIDLHPKGAK